MPDETLEEGAQAAAEGAHKSIPCASMISMLPPLRGANAPDFFSTLLTVQSLAGWSDAQAIALTTLKLEGPAKLYYESSCSNTKFATVLALRDNFLEHFKDTKNLSEVISDINLCIQTPLESVKDFASRLEGLVQSSLKLEINGEQPVPPTFMSQLLLHQFMTGLKSQIKAQVMIANPPSFAEAKTLAVRVEKSLNCVAPNINAVTTSPQIGAAEFAQLLKSTTDSYTQALSTMTEKLEAMQVQINSMSQSNRGQNFNSGRMFNQQGSSRSNHMPRQSVECFYCKKRGHVAKNCFQKSRDSRLANQNPGVDGNQQPLN